MTGNDFKKWRKAMGWSQVKTALAFEKNVKTITRYELGVTPIPAPVVMAATFLAISQEDGARVMKTISAIRKKYGLAKFNG